METELFFEFDWAAGGLGGDWGCCSGGGGDGGGWVVC